MNEVAITSDGRVTTCCIDPEGHNAYGNLVEESFDKIWSEGFWHFRQKNLYRRAPCFSCIGRGSVLNPNIISTSSERAAWSKPLLPYPKSAVIEISCACNYACDGCAANYLPRQRNPFLNFEKIKDTLSGLLPHLEKVRLYNYGEPLLNKNFTEILYWIKQVSPVVKIAIATNAVLLDEQTIRAIVDCKVDAVSVSIHGGPGTENMLKYSCRNADYEKALEKTALLVEHRNRQGTQLPFIKIKAVLFCWNDSDPLMDQLRADGKSIGVDAVHWTLDQGSGLTARASKRFVVGSESLRKLQESNELT